MKSYTLITIAEDGSDPEVQEITTAEQPGTAFFAAIRAKIDGCHSCANIPGVASYEIDDEEIDAIIADIASTVQVVNGVIFATDEGGQLFFLETPPKN